PRDAKHGRQDAYPTPERTRRFGNLTRKCFNSIRCGLGLLRGRYAQQALRFIEQPLRVAEGLVADVLPADLAGGVDEVDAVQGDLFEIVVGAVGFEGVERNVGEDREGEAGRLLGFLEGVLQALR